MKPHWVWMLIAGVELVLVVLIGLWPPSDDFTWQQLSLSSAVLSVFALALVVVSILLLVSARSRSSDDADTPGHVEVLLALVATGLASFLGIAIAGLAAGTAIFQDQATMSTQVVLTAGVVASYLMLVLYVREAWILVPAATLLGVSGQLLVDPPPRIPSVPLWSDGFFVRERQRARVARLKEVQNADAMTLDSVRVRAYRDAQGIDELKQQQEVLAKPVADAARETIRSAALDVAVVASNRSSVQYILLMKVQNQLLVLIFLLLAAVATFGVLGWALPMLFGAIGALIVRVRKLTPLGDPTKIDGGARWMVLLLTPLVGAVSSVIGLVLIRALEEFEVLSDDIAKVVRIPAFDGAVAYFPVATLAVAAAFGWTARLLDALMSKVTTLVDKADSGSNDTNPSNARPDLVGPNHTGTSAADQLAAEQAAAQAAAEQTAAQAAPEQAGGRAGTT